MKIKNLFDDLKQIGRKKYFFRNGEEEVYFSNGLFELEISYINGFINLAVTYNGIRNNYLNSDFFSEKEKNELAGILSSTCSIECVCKELSCALSKIATEKATPLPEHLSSIATNIKRKKRVISFDVVCPCSCPTFQILIKVPTKDEEEKLSRWNELLKVYNGGGYSDDFGNIYLVKKSLFGIKSKKLKVSLGDIPNVVEIVKAKCTNCGKEHILFDNSEQSSGGEESKEYDFRTTNANSVAINLSLNPEKQEELSYIEIYEKRSKSKRLIFSEEI